MRASIHGDVGSMIVPVSTRGAVRAHLLILAGPVVQGVVNRCRSSIGIVSGLWDFVLPWRDAEDRNEVTGDQIEGILPVEQKAPFAGITVMVIDDSKTIRRTAETLLSKAGCDVVTATDGFESLSRIVESEPDIIFVDIMMPRLDGYQTCALIKRNPQYRDTPVVMLSSKDGLFDRARGRVVGSDQYLIKPFTRNELLGAIERHVTNAR